MIDPLALATVMLALMAGWNWRLLRRITHQEPRWWLVRRIRGW